MVSRRDLKPATPGSVMFGKLSATLAQYLAEDNSGNAGENLTPEIRLSFLNLLARSVRVLGTRTFGHPAADFGPAGLASEAKQSNVCGCPRGRADSP